MGIVLSNLKKPKPIKPKDLSKAKGGGIGTSPGIKPKAK